MTHVEKNLDLENLGGDKEPFDYEEPFINEPVIEDEDEDEDWNNLPSPEDEEE